MRSLDWCHKSKRLIVRNEKDFHVYFLDKKRFYTTSKRWKVKVVPPGPNEEAEKVALVHPITKSHQHAIEVMYLGGVGLLVPKEVTAGKEIFDGKIFLDGVSESKG